MLPSSSGLGAVAGLERLRAGPNSPFFLIHYPHEAGSWSCEVDGLDGPTWTPDLVVFSLVPGCGGVRTTERGEPASAAYEQALINLGRRGAAVYMPAGPALQVDDPEHLPAGVPPGPYIRQVETTTIPDGQSHGLPYYHLAHETMTNGRTPTAPHKRTLDGGAWNRWRVALVDDGTIPPPAADVIEERIDQQRRKVASAARDTRANADVRAAAVTEQQTRLDRMIAARLPGPAPAPAAVPVKRTRKRTRKPRAADAVTP